LHDLNRLYLRLSRSKWIRSTWFVADYVHFCADYSHADGDGDGDDYDDEENRNYFHLNIQLVAVDDYDDVHNRCVAMTEHYGD